MVAVQGTAEASCPHLQTKVSLRKQQQIDTHEEKLACTCAGTPSNNSAGVHRND